MVTMSSDGVSMPSSSSATTKVYYYVDDDTTPFVSVLPVPTEQANLAQLKKSLGRKGFKYFCKQVDADIGGEVKVEILDDFAPLHKSQNGFIEVYLLSSGGNGTLTRMSGTLPRRVVPMHAAPNDKRRSVSAIRGASSLDDLHPPSQPVSSRGGTVVSRRAGEHLAEMYTSNSEDPYRYQDSRYSLNSSACDDTFGAHEGEIRRRKPRKHRFRKAYVPSTISSVPESRLKSGGCCSGTSMSLPRILEIRLQLRPTDILGISVVSIDGSILVSDVIPGGVVARDGRIDVGDQIVKVNRKSFENLSDSQAIAILRRVAVAKKPLTLYMVKRPVQAGTDPLSSIASETLPLDISLWVESAIHCTERHRYGVDDSTEYDAERMDSIGTTDDEEERILYEERRNGAIPPLRRDDIHRRLENQRNEMVLAERLTSSSDPSLIIRAMARPDSGLQVKNRKWLKIVVPMSFIGRELVDWILEHVADIHDRKAARMFASSLLERGFIRHVVSKLSFTEKCYYVFEESIIGTRGGSDSTQNSGGTMRDGTTEVTYVGSPRVAVASRGVSGDPHWPISPITIYKQNGRGMRRSDCESRMTNEYASMAESASACSPLIRQPPPPNTPLSGVSIVGPTQSPTETEFEVIDDDRKKIMR